MKAFWSCCLLSALVSTSFAAAPQYKTRTDIATGFKFLYGMAVADFNGDGKPDIVATDNNAKNLYVYLNDGTGNFGTPKITPITMTALGPGQIITGDFNEDGRQDVIVDTVAGIQADILLTGNGDGSFTQQQNLPGSYGFVSGVAVDVNNDKHLDLVLGGNGSMYVYLGDGHGGFQAGTINQGGSGLFTGVTTADFNRDNNLDTVSVSPISIAGIRFYPGTGNGDFSSPTILNSSSFPQPQSVASADFDGDGNPDLLVGVAYASVILPGNGDGTFNISKKTYLFTPVGNITSNTYSPEVAAVDVDGDKKIDAIVSDDVSHTINIFLNDGTGKFLQTTPDFSAAIDSGVSYLAVADLNGDGIPDLVISSNITQNISIFLSIKPKATPTISLTSNSPSQFVGTSISFTAQVSGVSGSTPTGTVTLMDGSTSLGQQTLNSNGQAVFSLSNLPTGQHNLTAAYAGDSDFNTVTSATLVQSITDLQLAFTTASQTISAGGTAIYSLTVTPVAGLSGVVTLTCSQLPSLTTCDPATVTLTGQPATATLTVRTTAPVHSQNSAFHYGLVFLPLLAVCSTRRRRILVPLLSISVLFALGTFAMGCSSGNSSSSSSTTTPGTPIGTTTFTVTGTITAGSQTLTRTSTTTLIVQ